MQYEIRGSGQSKQAAITYHLAIVDQWNAQKGGESYTPGAYEADGFIHCTNGLDLLTDVANLFYTSSHDDFTVLVLDMNRIESEWRYDDPGEQFPHIYGALSTSAVVGELSVKRAVDGTFIYLGDVE